MRTYTQDYSTPLVGGFFGQSSLGNPRSSARAALLACQVRQTMRGLQLFAPLGCVFQTGAGTRSKLAKVQSEDNVAITGHTIATRDMKARHTVKPIIFWRTIAIFNMLNCVNLWETVAGVKPLSPRCRFCGPHHNNHFDIGHYLSFILLY